MSDITSKDIEDNAPRTRQPHKEEFMLYTNAILEE